jgi:hypothetical protein
MIRRRSAKVLGAEALQRYESIGPVQPLMLVPEPGNPVDPNAVLLNDLYGKPVGYVAREDAAEVAAKIASGWVLMATTKGYPLGVPDGRGGTGVRKIVIWSDGEEDREVEVELFNKLAPSKTRAHDLIS